MKIDTVTDIALKCGLLAARNKCNLGFGSGFDQAITCQCFGCQKACRIVKSKISVYQAKLYSKKLIEQNYPSKPVELSKCQFIGNHINTLSLY